MPNITCPCGSARPIPIDFDAGEASRAVPCPCCYGENWADRETPESDPIRHGKVLTLRADGTASVAQDHG